VKIERPPEKGNAGSRWLDEEAGHLEESAMPLEEGARQFEEGARQFEEGARQFEEGAHAGAPVRDAGDASSDARASGGGDDVRADPRVGPQWRPSEASALSGGSALTTAPGGVYSS
jgi:hypothetical protein